MTDVDQTTIEEMRLFARQGATPTQLLYFLRGRLSTEMPAFLVDAARYFSVAFDMRVGDAKFICATPSMFGGSSWTDNEVDERLLPMIRGDRRNG